MGWVFAWRGCVTYLLQSVQNHLGLSLTREFRLPPHCKRDLRCSGILLSVDS